jgi:hypothetical protein
MRTREDEELLSRFHLMTKDEREFYLLSFRVCTTGREKKKPELRLLLGGASLPSVNKCSSGLG